MNLPNHVIVAVHQGGLLHDIGKIGTPEITDIFLSLFANDIEKATFAAKDEISEIRQKLS